MKTSKGSARFVTIPELISALSAIDVPNAGVILIVGPSLKDDLETIDPSDLYEDNLTDGEADAMTLRDAGWGTDEDYWVPYDHD